MALVVAYAVFAVSACTTSAVTVTVKSGWDLLAESGQHSGGRKDSVAGSDQNRFDCPNRRHQVNSPTLIHAGSMTMIWTMRSPRLIPTSSPDRVVKRCQGSSRWVQMNRASSKNYLRTHAPARRRTTVHSLAGQLAGWKLVQTLPRGRSNPPDTRHDLDQSGLTGVIIRINWSEIQIDNQGVIEFRWDDLDREMNKAVANGKLFTLDVRAGKAGTPTWIFNNYAGPAAPGPVTPLTFKDWASEAPPPRNNCGFDFTLGSPMHTNYRDLYVAMINAMATHVASDSRWFQALAHVKISGSNLLSSEARLPKRCYDGNGDGVLDTDRAG